ncbi:MAG: hypothetical protein REI11_16660, partial [Patulibacter sp.]|nr:hypothetical protein [Patulibacter sp.]
FTPPSGAPTVPGGAAQGAAPTASGGTTGTGRGGFGGGGGFGGDQTAVNAAVVYARAHGGGTVVVSGQSGAEASIIAGNQHVAGIGGFSGSESAVSMSWFADRVAEGDIRWVVTSGGGFGGRDGRIGSKDVMANVEKTCTAVPSVSGLYDCQGSSAALRSTGP